MNNVHYKVRYYLKCMIKGEGFRGTCCVAWSYAWQLTMYVIVNKIMVYNNLMKPLNSGTFTNVYKKTC